MTLAQWLERPDALQREGHRFDSDMLHKATSEEAAFLISTNPNIMENYVYILYSEKCDKYYVGHSCDVERRIDEHNSGRGGKYTSRCKPWELMYKETYESKTLAVNRELEIKNKKSRKYIERLIKKKNQNGISSAS